MKKVRIMDQNKYETLLQNALDHIRQLKGELETQKQNHNQPIAVIGMACRLPEKKYVYDGTFWDFIIKAESSITTVPEERWDNSKYFNPDSSTPGYTYSSHGSFLSQIENFDAGFFGISPREAIYIDPQHRFMMECAWEALEDANIPPKTLKGEKVGIFMAQGSDDYNQLANTLERRNKLDYYSGTGTSRSMLAGRLSYILGVHGPSIQVDTSCSSSLTALHLAIQSLRSGECDMALVGGVQMNLSPMSGILRSQTQALSPDGQCKAFSNDANGFVQGEGVGVIVISLLSKAKSQNRNIRAKIRGSAINHDGPSAGLTAPNEAAQINLLHSALQNSNTDPCDVGYIETHGTGTVLGDPIEVNALHAVYGKNRDHPLWIGSVKSNIGHLEAAAGVVSVIKTILTLEHKTIPPHIFSDNLNQHIDWDSIPLKIPDKPLKWESHNKPRCAAISSFGMSGTNAHIVLEEYNEPRTCVKENNNIPHLFTLSAKTEGALLNLAKRYLTYLSENQIDLSSLCYTTATCRDHYKFRLCAVVETNDQLKNFLEDIVSDERQNKTVFVSADQKVEQNMENLLKSIPGLNQYLKNLTKENTKEGTSLANTNIEEFLRSLGLNEVEDLESVLSSHEKLSNSHLLLTVIAEAYVRGREINWSTFYEASNDRPISLPPYAFQGKALWLDGLRT